MIIIDYNDHSHDDHDDLITCNADPPSSAWLMLLGMMIRSSIFIFPTQSSLISLLATASGSAQWWCRQSWRRWQRWWNAHLGTRNPNLKVYLPINVKMMVLKGTCEELKRFDPNFRFLLLNNWLRNLQNWLFIPQIFFAKLESAFNSTNVFCQIRIDI